MNNKEKLFWEGKYGPVMIAEIGGNHEGDFEYAKQLARLAIDCDVDYVKFQLYTGDSLVSPVESPVRNNHFKKFELTKEQHIELAEMCSDAGVSYLASVWDIEMLDWIDPYLPVYKIGSGDLTAYPVLQAFAERSKPIILSTGLSTLEDVLGTVEFLQQVNPLYKNPEYLALLQCTSMYPIEEEDSNLKVMDTLRQETGLTVGYSDHTEGSLALEASIAMGAEVLEFHFTDQREGKEFRDHKVSLLPVEVKELQARAESIRKMLGKGEKTPLQCEIDTNHVTSFRRAIYTNKDLPEGHVLTEADLVCLRPNHGIDAREWNNLIGLKLARPQKAFTKMRLN